MLRPIVMGLGAAGALSAAVVTGVSVTRPEPRTDPRPDSRSALAATLANASDETVCVESNLALVEGMRAACYGRAQYEAMRDRAVIGGDGAPVRLSLAHPTDAAVPAAMASTCAEYDSLVAEGWGALSGADMRREAFFQRACGALTLLVSASPARDSHFAGGKAAPEDVRSMAQGDAIAFGEAAPAAAIDVVNAGKGVWKLSIGQGETIIYEIAHANFTGDGLGEILAYLSVGAAGGTARAGSIGLIEKPAANGPCVFKAR